MASINHLVLLCSAAFISLIVSGASSKIGDSQQSLASLHGDPHFVGADGIHFHFTGEVDRTYCLFTDQALHVNVLMGGVVAADGSARTWVNGIGVLAGDHRLSMHARKGADSSRQLGFVEKIEVDEQQVWLPLGHTIRTDDGDLTLEFIGHGKESEVEVESYSLSLKSGIEIVLKVRPEAPSMRLSDEAFIHFAVDIMEAPGLTDPHGIMGQSFRKEQLRRHFNFRTEWNEGLRVWQVAGQNGKGYLDGNFQDYQSSSLLQPDCFFNRFVQTPENLLKQEQVQAQKELAAVAAAVESEKLADSSEQASAAAAAAAEGSVPAHKTLTAVRTEDKTAKQARSKPVEVQQEVREVIEKVGNIGFIKRRRVVPKSQNVQTKSPEDVLGAFVDPKESKSQEVDEEEESSGQQGFVHVVRNDDGELVEIPVQLPEEEMELARLRRKLSDDRSLKDVKFEEYDLPQFAVRTVKATPRRLLSDEEIVEQTMSEKAKKGVQPLQLQPIGFWGASLRRRR
eukprot:TRINITY_DN5726_c0_g1_i4.p1 TRINITY_DN5726_c0_g1~~TRINITY_DN5726_c0_g1_i4.p1  ORF type:complete len:510 (-),score=131.62 TRINITY_DN5726_c0_g1_i4:393-1922(-)